jgi:hypothetical protein
MLEARHSDHPDYPDQVRSRSEETSPTCLLGKTGENHTSVLVSHTESVSIRLSVTGYRVLMKSGDRFSPFTWAGFTTVHIRQRSHLRGVINELMTRELISADDGLAALAQAEAWPEHAQTAWSLLNRATGDLPPYAPEGLKNLRAYLRGV